MKEINYTNDEVKALIAPLVGFEPEDICGYAIVALTHDGDIQAGGNGDTMASIHLLRAASLAMILSPSQEASEPAKPAEPNPLASESADVDDLLRRIFPE